MMSRCVSWSRATLLSMLIPGVCSAGERGHRAEVVELFAALEAKQIEVTVIPEDATRLTIQVANQQDTPLTIRLPDAVAAVPVLAQLRPPLGAGAPFGQGLPFGPGAANNRPGGNQPAQGLGAPLGQMGRNNMFPGGLLPGGLMNVLPGKIVRQKLPCVCLDFGKPNPQPHIPYRLERLENVQDEPAVRDLLLVLGRGGSPHRSVQLAIWHTANSMSWEQLARVPHVQANGTKRPQFSPTELEQAQRLVKQLPSTKRRPTESPLVTAPTAAESDISSVASAAR